MTITITREQFIQSTNEYIIEELRENQYRFPTEPENNGHYIYRNAHRGLYVANMRLEVLFKEEYERDWVVDYSHHVVDDCRDMDTLLKKHLKLSDEELGFLKQQLTQEISYINIIPLQLRSLTQGNPIIFIYNTDDAQAFQWHLESVEKGKVHSRTITSFEGMYNANDRHDNLRQFNIKITSQASLVLNEGEAFEQENIEVTGTPEEEAFVAASYLGNAEEIDAFNPPLMSFAQALRWHPAGYYNVKTNPEILSTFRQNYGFSSLSDFLTSMFRAYGRPDNAEDQNLFSLEQDEIAALFPNDGISDTRAGPSELDLFLAALLAAYYSGTIQECSGKLQQYRDEDSDDDNDNARSRRALHQHR